MKKIEKVIVQKQNLSQAKMEKKTLSRIHELTVIKEKSTAEKNREKQRSL